MAVHTVDPTLHRELEKFGASDINACFNCGNCTAVCQLSETEHSFPRQLIRFGQIGMRDKLISAREMWLCWNCRDCSSTCPRQARPSEYVEAARRYAVASYDRTTLARRLYMSGLFTAGFGIILAVIFALLLMSGGGRMDNQQLALFSYIPYELVHDMGIAVLAIMGIVALISLYSLLRGVIRAVSLPNGQSENAKGSSVRRAINATREVVSEMVAQKRFRSCEVDSRKPLALRPWFVHYTIMWGFIGLLLATMLDFAFKTPGTYVDIWYPPRLIGTVAGLALTYGMIITIARRWRPVDATSSRMLPSDWLFLWLMLAGGVLGFAVEVAVYWPTATTFGYLSFLVHVTLAMELLILFPFTKFAHVLYRPVALWIMRYQESPSPES